MGTLQWHITKHTCISYDTSHDIQNIHIISDQVLSMCLMGYLKIHAVSCNIAGKNLETKLYEVYIIYILIIKFYLLEILNS